VTYRPPPVRRPFRVFLLVTNPRRRQAQAFLVAAAAALVAVGGATADPSVSAKQTQAQQVLSQINSIDMQLGAAVEAYNTANVQLDKIQGDLRDNTFELGVARKNLKRSQVALASRLVSVYTSGEQNSTLAVLLGSSSLDDLLNKMETMHSTSKQDANIVRDVTAAKLSIQRHRAELQHARSEQQRIVAERQAQRQHIESQLAERRQLLSSIRSEIAQIKAQEEARQLQLARDAQARLASPSPIGVGASTPEGSTVAPPSIHGGVVGIAMRYLGVPYVWGGASPSGFDCSGFVMYVFAQIGVSRPHSSYSQYGMGASVSMSQLQPGDLVFFAGASHVGIYIGGGQFIHAPHTGDHVKISSLTGWYASTFAGGRRV
jgi:cell wall-associated NlpC family hydrolase